MNQLTQTPLLTKTIIAIIKKHITLIVILLIGITIIGLGIFFQPKYPGIFFHDDAFYYLKIAQNIGLGYGSSFDGINPTNGYHPLYALTLSIISHIFPLTGINGILTVYIFDTICLVAALFFIDKLLSDIQLSTTLRFFVIIATSGLIGLNDFGMEVRLLLPLTWLFLYYFSCLDLNKLSSQFFLSAIGMIIFLTRIDYLLLVFSVSFVFSCANFFITPKVKTRQVLIQLSIFMLPSILALIAYFMFNQYEYGRPTSVSSWLKKEWLGSYYIFSDMKANFLPVMRVIVCFGISITLIGFFVRQMWKDGCDQLCSNKRLLMLIAVNIFVVSYMFIVFTFSKTAFSSWYLAFPLSVAVFTFAFILDKFIENSTFGFLSNRASKRILKAIPLFGAIIFFPLFLNYKIDNNPSDNAVAMGIWMKNNLSKSARIFQVDNSGFTGYFSERAVINGDGRVNSWEYIKVLKSNKLIDYLKRHQVNYILWDEYADEERIKIPLPSLHNKNKRQKLEFVNAPEEIAKFGRFILLKANIGNLRVVQSGHT